MEPPAYFDSIRQSTAARWQQLESDPELAAPWYQLFNQVRSPRHVLSELLQNADDAGATRAAVTLEEDVFVFEHNGRDFTKDDFASLCRFGYSNKRAMHTIGFRGIGFKSTFSLGDRVTIGTPTLSVAFDASRFTQPEWIDRESGDAQTTTVRVRIGNARLRTEVEKNLMEWQRSAPSLLFFRSLRSLSILGFEMSWHSGGAGPVSNSEWMVLPGEVPMRVLLVRSDAQDFPTDALDEIRTERMLRTGDETTFPPCRVEVVVGIEGRLYAVLPTAVETDLPFACNAPFLQRPDRADIKDPEVSATNRWLLARIGSLAAATMTEWLANESLPIEQRAEAYRLFAATEMQGGTLAHSSCAKIVDAFHSVAKLRAVLLVEDGGVVRSGECGAVPAELFLVWPPEVISVELNRGRPVLSRHVSNETADELVRYEYLTRRSVQDVATTLESVSLPKPATWRGLLHLWSIIAAEFDRYRYYNGRCAARIIPVQGTDLLQPVSNVVRLGEKQLLQSDEDWQFLSSFVHVLNPNWTRYLTEQRRLAESNDDPLLAVLIGRADRVLTGLLLAEASDTSRILAILSERVEDTNSDAWERAARIAAALSAQVPPKFRFLTRDNFTTTADEGLVLDINGSIAQITEPKWYEEHALADSYLMPSETCTPEQWKVWVDSEKSRLTTFVPLRKQSNVFWKKEKAKQLIRERGARGEAAFRYVTHEFVLEDWDFEAIHWEYWNALAGDDASIWSRVLEQLLRDSRRSWQSAMSARVIQRATTGTTAAITMEPLLPRWILQFRELPCLQDTWGNYGLPAELLRRTPSTESLLGIERFVRAEVDVEANRDLLRMLGVRDTPTGPAGLLDRLRTLSRMPQIRLVEIEKWFRSLDQLLTAASTNDLDEVRRCLSQERLILAEDESWVTSNNVFLASDEDGVPGAAVIHRSLRNLALWQRVGVGDRPSVDLALTWLKGLPSGEKLSPGDLRRVRALLPRYARRIWAETGHWLNVEGEWVPTESLQYAVTMQTLTAWKHLFLNVRQRVAALNDLPIDILREQPFLALPSLASVISESATPTHLLARQHEPWLSAFGAGLAAIDVHDEAENLRLRALGRRLIESEVQLARSIESTSCIDGVPAGTARSIDAVWQDGRLYVTDGSRPKVARAITDSLAATIAHRDLADALRICYDRDERFVRDFMREAFEIADDILEFQELPKPTGSIVEPIAAIAEPPSVAADNNQDLPDAPTETTSRRTRQLRPPLLDRFALAHSLSPDGNGHRAPDGSTLLRDEFDSATWHRYSISGERLHSYWGREQRIDGLQIPVEIWRLIEQTPDRWSVITVDGDHRPVEIPASRIMTWVRTGVAVMHAATYRLELRDQYSAVGSVTTTEERDDERQGQGS